MSRAERRALRSAIDGLSLARPGRTALAVAVRPGLWCSAVRLGLRTAPAGWWHRWPATPVPPSDYIAFRRQTMLGSATTARLEPTEIVGYLRWCRRMRALGG